MPFGHRFPMLKYELIPGQLLHEGTVVPENIFAPSLCPVEIVLWTHDKDYLNRLHQQHPYETLAKLLDKELAK